MVDDVGSTMAGEAFMKSSRLAVFSICMAMAAALIGCDLFGGDEDEDGIVGTWKGTVQLDADPTTYADAYLKITNSGTYEVNMYDVGTTTPLQSGSNYGTYTYDGHIFSIVMISQYDGSAWQPVNQASAHALDVDGDVMIFNVDMNVDGVADFAWTLARQ